MRHCVATYWQNVVNGESRIYSILEKGSRVATLELTSRVTNYRGRTQVGQLVGQATRAQHLMCPRQLAPLSRRSTNVREIFHWADATIQVSGGPARRLFGVSFEASRDG
jgi:hypothetical protein